MKYIEYLNGLIRAEVIKKENCVLFGQNINAGSCLGGLTRNITVNSSSKIFNSTNAENSLVGLGFGLLMNDACGVFFMKQLDFLLLGIDQLVNTYNIIRSLKEKYPTGSFTIVATVVDSGYEGPQSSFNSFHELCSIARIDGYTVSNKAEADHVFSKHFLRPGFRIIALSQRLGKGDMNETTTPLAIIDNGEIFQYKKGKDVTVVSFNFSSPQASGLVDFLSDNNISASHFNVNPSTKNLTAILDDLAVTGKIVIIDDSKSFQIPGDRLLAEACGMEIKKKIVLKRELKNNWLYPVSDLFTIDHEDVLAKIKN